MGKDVKKIKPQTGDCEEAKEEPGGSSCKEIVIQKDWISAYKNSIKTIDELSRTFPLGPIEKQVLKHVTKTYQFRVTHYYLSLIKNIFDFNDPIRKQCIPSQAEMRKSGYDSIDPLGEEKTSPVSCLVHRYPDRALLVVTGRCFMYCRHCTRKRLWGANQSDPTLRDIERALVYVKQNEQIREIIVSGGDPLTLPTERLDYIINAISKLKNIEAIRIGTRAPVVFPQRIDKALCAMLEKYENLWINVQFNHPNEITPESEQACRRLQKKGIVLSNQAVLLKGINDDAQTMTELCHKLQKIRVRPYYLFQCDPIMGACHFRTSVFKGVEILEKMRGHTSGMCVPTFVVDGIDGKGKIPLNPNYLVSLAEDGVTLRNYNHETFFYGNPTQ